MEKLLLIIIPLVNFIFMFIMTACNIINTRANFRSMLFHKERHDKEIEEIKKNLEKLL